MKPSIDYLRECFELEAAGVLRWRERPAHHFNNSAAARSVNRQRAGTVAGWVGKDGYLLVRVGRIEMPAHVVVFALDRGAWPEFEVDHHDRNRANNEPTNLRPATRSQNMANMGPHRDNKLGLRGVTKHSSGRFRARISQSGKSISLGMYDLPEEASAAYCKAEKQLRKEYSHQ